MGEHSMQTSLHEHNQNEQPIDEWYVHITEGKKKVFDYIK